jgi:hypothetical protein
MAPQWIKDVRWFDAAVSVNPTREAVKGASLDDAAAQLDGKRETDIYEHFGRHGYWADEVKREAEMSGHQVCVRVGRGESAFRLSLPHSTFVS